MQIFFWVSFNFVFWLHESINKHQKFKDGELWVLDEAVIYSHSENSDKRLIVISRSK